MFRKFQLKTTVSAARIFEIVPSPEDLSVIRLIGLSGRAFIVDQEWIDKNKPKIPKGGYGYLVRNHAGDLIWMNRNDFERDYEPWQVSLEPPGPKRSVAEEDRDTIIEPPGSKERRRIIDEETDGRIDL